MASATKSIAVAILALIGVALPGGAGAQDAETEDSIELIDPHVFRACADPRNLPFSNEAGEGFENKIAELFAQQARQVGRLHVLSRRDRLHPQHAQRPSLRRRPRNRSRRRHRSTDQPLLSNQLRRRVSRGRSPEGARFAERSASEDGEDRHRRGHPAGDSSGRQWTARPNQILRAGRRHALQFADPRDDGRPGPRRHRRCVALGSDRGLLRVEGQEPDDGRPAREGCRTAPAWSIGSSWGCGIPIRIGSAPSTS